jgi:hypothetical protein
MSYVTRILSAIDQGDPHATEQLLPLVRRATQACRRETGARKARTDASATARVHEAYLRLVDTEKVQKWNSRGHFFAAAAEAMRRILIDQARRKSSEKAGDNGIAHGKILAGPSSWQNRPGYMLFQGPKSAKRMGYEKP